jgi:predicted GNAT family N-acyltransferase
MEIRPARTQEELVSALRLRVKVFILEQQVPPEIELDAYDETAEHILVYSAGVPVGTGRLIFADGKWKIGRMAVERTFRRSGVGRLLMQGLETKARERGAGEIHLAAQCRVEGFYHKLGYVSYGGVFDDAGIDHIMMRKVLS